MAKWRETTPVHEVINGQTVLHGRVEVFDLLGHPKAKRVYTWSRDAANGEFFYLPARHGEVEQVVEHILKSRAERIHLTRNRFLQKKWFFRS